MPLTAPTFLLQATSDLPSERLVRVIIFHLCHAISKYRSINLTVCTTRFVLLRQKSVCECLHNTGCMGLEAQWLCHGALFPSEALATFSFVHAVCHDRLLSCRNQLSVDRLVPLGLHSVYADFTSLLYSRVVWWQKHHSDILYVWIFSLT